MIEARPALFALVASVAATVAAVLVGAGCSFHAVAPRDGGALDGGALPSTFTVYQGLPVGETLMAIWGADADNIFAVGTNGLHDDYFAGTWHRAQTTLGRDYYGMWGSSATDVYAVGVITSDGSGVVQHFDGASWRDEYLAPTALYGIWSTGPLVLAVGALGQLYGKYTGTTAWASRLMQGLPANPKVTGPADAPVLWAISGNGANDWSIAADVDRIFHYEGNGNFVNLDPSVDRSIVFRSVWAAPGDVTSAFFGTNYFGAGWLSAGPPPPGDTLLDDNFYRLFEDRTLPGADQLFLRGIWGDATDIVFVGDQGRIYRYDVGADDFARVTSPSESALFGVWGSSIDDIWIVGERELILHGGLSR